MISIVAVDKHWGIGKNNGLLFDIKADMRHFVEHTRGKVVVMGSNTLRSLPGGMPLKNRVNIVLDPEGSEKDASAKGYTLVRSPEELLRAAAKYPKDEVYVIGGGMMYRTLLPYCDEGARTATPRSSTKTSTPAPNGRSRKNPPPSRTAAIRSPSAPTGTPRRFRLSETRQQKNGIAPVFLFCGFIRT